MRASARTLALGFLCGLSAGCANFDAIRAFAKDGSAVAAAAKKDVDIAKTSCADVEAEATVLAYAAGQPSAATAKSSACANAVKAHEAAAAHYSVQLLVKYHEALNALAGDENWSLDKEISALGGEVKKLKADGKVLVSSADVDGYQKAFAAIADLLTSALREREAKRLLAQDLDWAGVLKPLRFWYQGPGDEKPSMFSLACRVIRTEWSGVESTLLDYARCDDKARAHACEPLTAGARLAAIAAKVKPIAACAPTEDKLPKAAAARAKLIDDWLLANADLRKNAFSKDFGTLQARLSTLRDQVDAIRSAFD